MAFDLRTLADEIAGTHQARKDDLAGIRKEKDEILRQSSELISEFRRLGMERQSEVFKMKKEVAGMLAAFRRELDGLRKEREKEARAWHGVISRLRTKKAREAAHGPRKKKAAKTASGK